MEDYEFRPFYNEQADGRGVALTYKNFLVEKYKPSKFSIALNLSSTDKGLHDHCICGVEGSAEESSGIVAL